MYSCIGVVGYPKSGNTWVRNIVSKLGQLVDQSYMMMDLDATTDKAFTPLLHPVIKVGGQGAVLFKSHLEYGRMGPRLGEFTTPLSLAKAVLIRRHPLDVLLSYINYIKFLVLEALKNGQPFPPGLRKYCLAELGLAEADLEETVRERFSLEQLRDAGVLSRALDSFSRNDLNILALPVVFSSWKNQTLSWRNQKDYPVFELSYEEFLADNHRCLEGLARFLDVPLDRLVVAADMIGKITSQARQNDLQTKHVSFYNKMKAGYYVNYFSPQEVAAFAAKHAGDLKEVGYFQ